MIGKKQEYARKLKEYERQKDRDVKDLHQVKRINKYIIACTIAPQTAFMGVVMKSNRWRSFSYQPCTADEVQYSS